MWKCYLLSCVQFFSTQWTVNQHTPSSMGLARQEYWSGLPYCLPGDLLNPGIESGSPALQMDSSPSKPPDDHLFYTDMKYGPLVFKVFLLYSPNNLLTKTVYVLARRNISVFCFIDFNTTFFLVLTMIIQGFCSRWLSTWSSSSYSGKCARRWLSRISAVF